MYGMIFEIFIVKNKEVWNVWYFDVWKMGNKEVNIVLIFIVVMRLRYILYRMGLYMKL